MRRTILAAAFASILAVAGCQNQNKDGGGNAQGGQPNKMSADACSMCPGTQTANADGTCPKCKM